MRQSSDDAVMKYDDAEPDIEDQLGLAPVGVTEVLSRSVIEIPVAMEVLHYGKSA